MMPASLAMSRDVRPVRASQEKVTGKGTNDLLTPSKGPNGIAEIARSRTM